MPNKNMQGDVDEKSYGTKMVKSEKDFKPHKMYCKDGSTHNAKTYKEHMALKKRGCGHKPIKNGGKKN